MTRTSPDNQTTIDRPESLIEDAWPYQVRTAHLENATVAYTDEGNGHTLLLIHDGMCSFVWVHLIGLLKDTFRVVTLDFPGSGFSPAGAGPVSLEADSHILEGFVDHLELDELTLIAHDLGGGVGLGLATRRPEAINGLCLVNTFAWPPHTAALRGMLRLMGSPSMSSLNSATNFMARASSGRFGVGRHFDRAQKEAFVHMFDRKPARQRFNALMASTARERAYLADVEAGLDRLGDRPVLTIFGERNDPFGFQDRWAEHFPHAEQMVIRGGYHFPMCDEPETVAKRITQWHSRET